MATKQSTPQVSKKDIDDMLRSVQNPYWLFFKALLTLLIATVSVGIMVGIFIWVVRLFL